MPTPGKWFCVRLDYQVMAQFLGYLDRDPGSFGENGNWKVAYHGTALDNIVPILLHGLAPGPNATQNKYGVYCEGKHRMATVYHYITHQAAPGQNPMLFFGAKFGACGGSCAW